MLGISNLIKEELYGESNMTHDLKILPEYFMAVALDKKTFEIRKNDRGYHVGDCLVLREWNGQEFTGRNIVRYVSYILYDWQAGLKDGYCIMSLKRSPANAVMDYSDQSGLASAT